MTSVIDKNIYNQLLIKFQPKVIENEEEYESFYHILLELMIQSEKSSEELAMMRLIAKLVEDFDNKQKKPRAASPHEILLDLMEEANLKQSDLVGKIGSKGVVSEIVNQKRSISKSQAKTLGEMFHVSPVLFI
jgi:HTH-type transcriptional regulator / antitoxin HigA